MKFFCSFLFVAFFLSIGAKAETCYPSKIVTDLLIKQRNMAGGEFYVTSPISKETSSGMTYEYKFSSVDQNNGFGDIGSVEVHSKTSKIVKFNSESSILLK